MRRSRSRRLVIGLVAGAFFVGGAVGLADRADASPGVITGCEQINWGFPFTQKRKICDTAIRPDGSWLRYRTIGIPAHYQNGSSFCTGGYWSSYCTFTDGGWVAQTTSEDTSYVVFPYNVLPDEPGHLENGLR